MIEAQVEVDRARGEILEQEHELESRLENLSFFTGEQYLVDDVEVADLPEPGELPDGFNAGAHPDVRRLDREIAKKEAEASMSRRSMLPVVSMYSRYSYYGTDQNSFDRAREDVNERGYNVGIVATLPITEGMRGQFSANKAELEASRLRVERAKRAAELRRMYREVKVAHASIVKQLSLLFDVKNMIEEKALHVLCLYRQCCASREDFMNAKIVFERQIIENEVMIFQQCNMLTKCKILIGNNI